MLQRAGEVRGHVEGNSINVGKYVKEIAIMIYEFFEQEHLRMINVVSAINPGGVTGSHRAPKGIMEHNVIQNLRAANGGKG